MTILFGKNPISLFPGTQVAKRACLARGGRSRRGMFVEHAALPCDCMHCVSHSLIYVDNVYILRYHFICKGGGRPIVFTNCVVLEKFSGYISVTHQYGKTLYSTSLLGPLQLLAHGDTCRNVVLEKQSIMSCVEAIDGYFALPKRFDVSYSDRADKLVLMNSWNTLFTDIQVMIKGNGSVDLRIKILLDIHSILKLHFGVSLFKVLGYAASEVMTSSTQWMDDVCEFIFGSPFFKENSLWFNQAGMRSNTLFRGVDLLGSSVGPFAAHSASILLFVTGVLGCAATGSEFSMESLSKFAEYFEMERTECDMYQYLMQALAFFAKGGYRIFRNYKETGDLDWSFLYGDSGVRKLSDKYYSMKDAMLEYSEGTLSPEKHRSLRQGLVELEGMLRNALDGCGNNSIAQAAIHRQINEVKGYLSRLRHDGIMSKAKPQPFGIWMYGGAGIGKSFLAKISAITLLKQLCKEMEEEQPADINNCIAYINATEKYDTNIQPFTRVAVLDDVGQNKDFDNETNAQLIRMVNATPSTANKADVSEKGNVLMDMDAVVVTSNLLCPVFARGTSRCPSALTRRFLHIDVNILPEFRVSEHDGKIDVNKKIAHYNRNNSYDNVWAIDVYSLMENGDKDYHLRGGTLSDYLQFLSKYVRREVHPRRVFANSINGVHDNLVECEACGCVCVLGGCSCQDSNSEIENQSIFTNIRGAIDRKYMGFLTETQRYHGLFCYLSCSVPSVLERVDEIYVCFMSVLLVSGVYVSWALHLEYPLVQLIVFCLTMLLGLFATRIYRVVSTFSRISKNFSFLTSSVSFVQKNSYAFKCLGAAGVIGILMLAIKKFRRGQETQGNLQPRGVEDVAERDAEVNPWVKVEPIKRPDSKFTSIEQVQSYVSRHVVYCVFKNGTKTGSCSGLMWTTNFMILPKHIHDAAKGGTVTLQRPVRGGFCNMVEDLLVDNLPYVDVPSCCDMVVVYITSLGTVSGLRDHMIANHEIKSGKYHSFRFNGLDCDTATTLVTLESASRFSSPKFDHYMYRRDNSNGMCGSLLLDPDFRIVGYHLAGNPSRQLCIAAKLDIAELNKLAVQLAQKVPGINYSASDESANLVNQGDVLEEVFLKKQIDTYNIPSSHMTVREDEYRVNWENAGFRVGSASYRTKVRESCISATVQAHLGITNEWRGPAFARSTWPNYRDTLARIADPISDIPLSSITYAVDTYLEPLIEVAKKGILGEEFTPLDHVQVINGIPGKRFVDRMPLSTSIGFPLNGPKRNYMTLVDEQNDIYDFDDPMFLQEIKRVEECYLEGRMAHPVFGASLKDEIVKDKKQGAFNKKVRVFYTAPIVIQYFVRKYYLPICRFLSLIPLDSMCAVGINALGKEWDQLHKFVVRYGEDRILAGDYSGYDSRMSCQVTSAAYGVMIKLAEVLGYDDRSLRIMRGIASDCVRPTVNYHQSLIQFNSSHISGVNVTVYIGSICNCILLGSFVHFKLGDKSPPIRDILSIVTYGDDFKGSVAEGFDQINFIEYRNYLARLGFTLTPPNKEATHFVEFQRDCDADFLKRISVWVPELGRYCSRLAIGSINQSLLNVQGSSLDEKEQLSQTMVGHMSELVSHGRETFNKYRDLFSYIHTIEWNRAIPPRIQDTYDVHIGYMKDRDNLVEERGSSFKSGD